MSISATGRGRVTQDLARAVLFPTDFATPSSPSRLQ